MNASSWIALASLGGFGLLQTAVFAYFMGTLTQRVKGLEGRPDTDCKGELMVLNTRFAAMEELVKELGHDIKNLLTGRVIPARRRVGDDA